jgi:hypothetical protein
VLLLVAGGFLASGVGDVPATDRSVRVDTDSNRADRLIEQRLRNGEARAFLEWLPKTKVEGNHAEVTQPLPELANPMLGASFGN